MRQNFFEKHPKTILLIINSILICLLAIVLTLDLFQDNSNSERYDIIDKVSYQIRCGGKRHIVMRENKPNLNSYRVPPYKPNAKYSFRTDENGFVEPSKIHENPDLKIFFLGGSTTECETVDEPNRFPYLVGRILEEKTDKKINSYNAGKSGNDTIHSLNNFINKIVPLSPQIVVRMDNINDLSTLLYEGTFWNKNKTRSNLSCFSKSADTLRNSKNEWEESPYVTEFSNPKHQAKIKEEYRKILKLFVASVKASGAIPVLMTQPNRIENNPNFTTHHGDIEFNQTYRKLYVEFHNIVRKVAREEGVLLIDLAKATNWDENYIYDSVHLNNDGSRFVAEVVAKELRRIVW